MVGPSRKTKAFTAVYVALMLLMPLVPLNFSDGVVGEESMIITVATDGSGDYTWIQDAINASVDGDTVFVKNGIYNESIIQH